MAPTQFLNLGSGPFYTPGWVNVDRYADDADVQCNAFELKDHFEPDTFSKVYMGHFLEHIEYGLIPELLEIVCGVSTPFAEVVVVGPCVDKARATAQPGWLIEQIEENPTPEKPGVGHAWTPTTELTLKAMRAGLVDVQEIPVAQVTMPEWPNRETSPWQVAARARVPSID